MDVTIISSLPAFTGLLRENMTHQEPAVDGRNVVTGRLGGWEMGLVSWEEVPIDFQQDLLEVQYIIGVGRVHTPVPYLRPQDILLSGEVHLEGNRVCAGHDRLIDLALKAGEELAEVQPGRVLVAQLWAESPPGEVQPELFAVGRLQCRVAALAWELGLPFVLLSTLASGDSEGERETAKKVFWVVKGTLENLRHFGS